MDFCKRKIKPGQLRLLDNDFLNCFFPANSNNTTSIEKGSIILVITTPDVHGWMLALTTFGVVETLEIEVAICSNVIL